MPIAVWSDSYLTGDPTVDNQHKQLFKLVNELHGAILGGHSQEVQGPTLKTLARYTVDHFGTEEGFMRSKGYPGLPEHQRKHEALVSRVSDLVAKFDKGELILPLTLSRFLSDWISHHIREEDIEMIQWLQRN